MASTAEQPSIGPAQNSKVHTAVCSCRPENDNASKQTKASQPLPRTIYEFSCFYFFCLSLFFVHKANNNSLTWIFPSAADTQPRDGPPSSYELVCYFLVWNIGVTGPRTAVFAVTLTTCSTLLLAVCVKLLFQPIDIQHTKCPCRFVILEAKAL